jgi:hypothetical protein
MKDLFNKLVRSKYSLIYLILFIALLYTLQEKAIMPLVLSVVKSEAFFEKPIEENEPLGKLDAPTERTAFAFANCREAVLNTGNLSDKAEFKTDHYETWALGNRQYLIRSSVVVPSGATGGTETLYACTIRLTGEDQSKPSDWSILGVDFNPDGQ